MNEWYKIKGKHLKNMADKFRSYLGTTDDISPEVMDEKVDEVYSKPWDALQANGNRTTYDRFCRNADIVGEFKPKYVLAPYGSIEQMFINNANLTTIANWGFSNAITSCLSVFANCTNFLGFVDENGNLIKDKPFFGSGVTDIRYAFQNNEKIKYICIDVSSNAQSYTGTFGRCLALEDLVIIGEIKHNGLNVSTCKKLTVASLLNILNALADKSADTSASWVVTIGTENLAKLTDAQKAIATDKGWSLV